MCPWCKDPNSESAENLCRMHEAEFLGTTVDDLDRGEAIQHAEWLDTLG